MPGIVWLAVASLALHGFCYVFFFTVAFIYTDMVAPEDARSSAQSLINVAVLGIGMLVGGFFAGWLKDTFTVDEVTNYTLVFTVPVVITLVVAVFFALLFRERRAGEAAAS
jgi:MFS family permease